MNLDYNILWIDDRPKQISDVQEHIRSRLARKGFDLQIKMLQEPGNDKTIQKHFNNCDFDLLVVDFKMQPNERTGDALIRSIRRFCDATDIVFYSSETPSSLRQKVDVDGVYCASRHDLKDTLEHVIHSTIKKALDLNSMRGISLAQLADFDHAIDHAISLGYEKLLARGEAEGIIDGICKTASSFHSESHKAISTLPNDKDISEYINFLSSSPKHSLLSKIIKRLNDQELDRCGNRISQYTEDVIAPRNRLAHSMEKSFKSGSYVIENKAREISYNENDFTILRLKLLEYKDHFRRISEVITRL